MLKIRINKDWSTAVQTVDYVEYYVDIDYKVWDQIVVCKSTGNICKLQDSEQGKERLKELQSKKELDEIEQAELEFLDWTFDEKRLASSWLIGKRFLVNITSKGKKKIATIHDSTTANGEIELDEDRWDKWFNSLEEAQEYANTFNS